MDEMYSSLESGQVCLGASEGAQDDPEYWAAVQEYASTTAAEMGGRITGYLGMWRQETNDHGVSVVEWHRWRVERLP